MGRPTRYRYKAEILKIKRADKFKAIVDLGFNTFKVMDLKLAGVNCKDDCPKSLKFVKDLIDGKTIDIQTIRDMKGVWLCSIWVDGYHLNSNLLKKGLGVEFHS